MVEVTLASSQNILLDATIITYGSASTAQITKVISEEIETLWNEAHGEILINRLPYNVIFRIVPQWRPDIMPEEVVGNTDPKNNYYRIEEYAFGNISFVDAIGSNSGYFKLENLYVGSTTAAHEFGHGIGLEHPTQLDIRGRGRPGIMYPRGTWVDPQFQYDPAAQPGAPGGTMHPMHRRVNAQDIENLRLTRLRFRNNKAILGDFTNVYHPDHREVEGIE
ncbi:peptidase M10 [Pollutibacter soli]|uniref:peptidase M10 n=1 Tax=Pollutibacter soli TaxID=3034157 RepID=UPI003013F1A6